MTTIIARYYATAEAAAGAVAELEEEGLRKGYASQYGAGATAADLEAGGVYASAAKAFADRLGQGGALVVVRAPFGQSIWAKDILDGHGPIASGVEFDELYVESTPSNPQRYDKYLPILLDPDTLIFSGSVLPPLAKSWSFSKMFGMPLLSNKQAGKAKLISGTPFSSALGLPTLIDKR